MAFQALSDFIFDDERAEELDEIRFVLFSDKDMTRYKEAAERYLEQRAAS